MITLVANDVYRGPRPAPSDYGAVKAKFARVISLEGLEEDHKEALEFAPLPVTSFPISAWQIYVTGISQCYLQRILQSLMQFPRPVLVHCQHGEDRTGLVIAAYRVRVCGWSKEQAWSEALKFGYRNWLNFGLNRTWRNFTAER